MASSRYTQLEVAFLPEGFSLQAGYSSWPQGRTGESTRTARLDAGGRSIESSPDINNIVNDCNTSVPQPLLREWNRQVTENFAARSKVKPQAFHQSRHFSRDEDHYVGPKRPNSLE